MSSKPKPLNSKEPFFFKSNFILASMLLMVLGLYTPDVQAVRNGPHSGQSLEALGFKVFNSMWGVRVGQPGQQTQDSDTQGHCKNFLDAVRYRTTGENVKLSPQMETLKGECESLIGPERRAFQVQQIRKVAAEGQPIDRVTPSGALRGAGSANSTP